MSSAMSRQVGSRAFDWIEQNLAQLNPFEEGRELDEFHQTSLGELALLCHLLLRGDAPRDPRIERCIDFLYSLYSRPAYHESVFRLPQAFVGHLLIWLVLRARGIEERVKREALQSLIDRVSGIVLSYDPYRVLELSYLLRIAGFDHPLPPDDEVFRHTLLGKRADILDYCDLYNITHTIFYISDFGLTLPAFLGEGPRHFLRRLLQRGLSVSIAGMNWDLVGEMILTFRCLGLKDEPAIGVGWENLCAMQQADGMIGESFNSFKLARENQYPNDQDDHFKRSYHRTLVAAMAGLVRI
jgi:hypothetical protein